MAKPSFGKKETPLDYGALVKNLRDKGPEKLYLLWGEEDYLLADFVSRLRAACVAYGHDLVDMMRHLRYSDARLHVREELPFHTGRRLESAADIAALLA